MLAKLGKNRLINTDHVVLLDLRVKEKPFSTDTVDGCEFYYILDFHLDTGLILEESFFARSYSLSDDSCDKVDNTEQAKLDVMNRIEELFGIDVSLMFEYDNLDYAV